MCHFLQRAAKLRLICSLIPFFHALHLVMAQQAGVEIVPELGGGGGECGGKCSILGKRKLVVSNV